MGDMTDDWEEYEDIILDDDSVRTGVLTVALCMCTTHPTDRVRAVHYLGLLGMLSVAESVCTRECRRGWFRAGENRRFDPSCEPAAACSTPIPRTRFHAFLHP